MNQKKIIIVCAKWCIFGLLIIWAVKIVNFHQIEDKISSISIVTLLLFLLISALSKVFYVMRWREICMCGLAIPNVPFFLLMRINLLAEFVGVATPTALSGEALRILKLKSVNINKIKAAATILIDRIVGLGSMMVLVLLLLPVIGIRIFQSIVVSPHRLYFLVLCSGLVCMFFVIILRNQKILASYQNIRSQIHLNFSLLAYSLFFSIIGHVLFVIGFYAIFKEIYPIPFLTASAFILTSQITRSIPISLFGIGLGDGTMIGLGSLLEIEAEVIFIILVISIGSRYLFAFLGLMLELYHDGKAFFKNLHSANNNDKLS